MKNALFTIAASLLSVSNLFACPKSEDRVQQETKQETIAIACEVTIKSNDQMQYDIKSFAIDTSACEDFTVHLINTGMMKKSQMGHNVVISKASDLSGISMDGISAGLDNDHIKTDEKRVLAFTKVIGGGEETSVTFKTSLFESSEVYKFFCSFPGHAFQMQGDIKLGE